MINQTNQDVETNLSLTQKTDLSKKFLSASGLGNSNLIKILLNQDSSLIYCSDNEGYTALHKASSEGHADVACTLISNKANINAQTIDEWTPLHCACKWNNIGVAEILLKAGSNINAISKGNVTPLHAAASEKYTREVLILLLSSPALMPELKNNAGDTGHDIAVRYNRNSNLFRIQLSQLNIFSK